MGTSTSTQTIIQYEYSFESFFRKKLIKLQKFKNGIIKC